VVGVSSSQETNHPRRGRQMKDLRLKHSRAARTMGLAVSAAGLAAVIGIAPAQAITSPSLKAHRASEEPKEVVAKLRDGVLKVKGTNTRDAIALRLQTGNPAVLQVDTDGDGSADASFARSDLARIVVHAGPGSDAVRIDESRGAFAEIPTTIDGGEGDDRIDGGSGAETLFGGPGDDTIDGNRGADTAHLGSGDDTFIWDPGDGSDVVEGEDGTDTMLFNGADVPEQFDLSANGSRLRFFRTQGNVTMDTAGVERVDLPALGGPDRVTVNDLAGTDVRDVNVDVGTADGQQDRVVVNATAGDDSIDVSGDASAVRVTGLAAAITVRHAEPANDRLEINTLTGADTVSSAGLAPGTLQLFVDDVLRP
jgi:RTX calcium-binding nonapeptide repeat (4 copies)